MSPAPQGGLQVERFIGSCLISAHHRGKNHNHHSSPRAYLPPSYHHPLPPPPQPHHHPSWTGAPLFCVANRKTARKGGGGGGFTRYQNNNKANDHVIVDDARSPLSRLAIHTQGAPLIQAERYNRHRNAPPPFRLYRGGNTTAVDAVSRNDDLPPKSPPAGAGACDSVSVASDESSTNSENSLPRIIKPRKRRKKDRKPPVTSTQQQQVADEDVVVAVEQEEKPAPAKDEKVVEVKSVGDDDDVLPPGLDQDDVPTTSCQCSYCDPVGVIWDADQRCYSPFLTPPPTPFLDGLALRRSWSEPSPPPATAPRTRTHSEPAPAPGGLEVSSQIITSPNGHRDIEIKFFSSRGPRAFVAEE